MTAYDVVKRLRPQFLQSRGPVSIANPTPTTPVVYLDGMRYGDVSALAGITFPTGKPPEEEGNTGTGAYQFNVGLAIEQTFGPWLVNATGVAFD